MGNMNINRINNKNCILLVHFFGLEHKTETESMEKRRTLCGLLHTARHTLLKWKCHGVDWN